MNQDPWQKVDSQFKNKVRRLHQLNVYFRWLFILFCWLIIAPIALWSLRTEIAIIIEYFTWSALRYTLIFNPAQTFLLATCIAITTSTLVWQSRNILWGMPRRYQQHLQARVRKIEARGKKHPLWDWIQP